ncbi:MAG: serine/threonine protein kinase [Anaerolineaceae bacterium]|nr:serine/threonine protein kinase [Anaerolineaceae bacterium]MCB9101877.1 serine/threonine protein kinase [Anaerolineales bacterium]
MEDLSGHSFGDITLTERLGAGGMATIYQAIDANLARRVAVKVIPMPDQASGQAGAAILARFRQEARAMAQLSHPHIITVYSYGETDDWAYIVMEYVPGGSLQGRLRRNAPVGWQRALNRVIPISQALAFVHKRGLIHGDVKPANILLAAEDRPLLADFGLARQQYLLDSGLFAPDELLGTMAYAAPEQIQNSKIDARIDIYALGIVLYQLLTGELPFPGETPSDFIMARLKTLPVPLLTANPHVPAIFAPMLDKALAYQPDSRYRSMDEFTRDLQQAYAELSTSKLSLTRTRLRTSSEPVRQWSKLLPVLSRPAAVEPQRPD